MEKDFARILGHSDVRAAPSISHKAVLLVTKYGTSQKATAKVLGVNLNLVRKALKAHSENRPLGRNGRPPKLNEEEEVELTTVVEKLVKEHRSPTKRNIAAEVCSILIAQRDISSLANKVVMLG
jgi:transposase